MRFWGINCTYNSSDSTWLHLVLFFPNRTLIHAITYTNCMIPMYGFCIVVGNFHMISIGIITYTVDPGINAMSKAFKQSDSHTKSVILCIFAVTLLC